MRQSCAATRSPAETEKSGFRQPKDGLIADGRLVDRRPPEPIQPAMGTRVPTAVYGSRGGTPLLSSPGVVSTAGGISAVDGMAGVAACGGGGVTVLSALAGGIF